MEYRKWKLVLDSNDDNASMGNDIITEKSYQTLSYLLNGNSKRWNSGVFFMVVEIPEVDAPWKTGQRFKYWIMKILLVQGRYIIKRQLFTI